MVFTLIFIAGVVVCAHFGIEANDTEVTIGGAALMIVAYLGAILDELAKLRRLAEGRVKRLP